jgi:hypothetical protein
VPSISIQWGAWTTGMAARTPGLLAHLQSSGMGAVSPSSGLLALRGLLLAPSQLTSICPERSTPPPSTVAAPFDWRLALAGSKAGPAAGDTVFGEFAGEAGTAVAGNLDRALGPLEAVRVSAEPTLAKALSIDEVTRIVMEAAHDAGGIEPVGEVTFHNASCAHAT